MKTLYNYQKIRNLWYNIRYRTHNSNSPYLRLRPNMKMEEAWESVNDESFYSFYIHVMLLPNFSPEKTLDRIDNDLGYLKDNLRWATTHEQNNNKSIYLNNNTGYRGIDWYQKGQKYECKIRYKGKNIHIGYFHCIKDALESRNEYIIENKLPNVIQTYEKS